MVVKPFDTRFFNTVEIMNELCLLSGSYLLIEFTEYELDPIFRYKIGWYLTAVMVFATVANMSCIIVKGLSPIF